VRDSVDKLLPYLSDLLTLWETYLHVGGFPQAVSTWLTTGEVSQAFTDALWDVIYGDAITSVRFTAMQTATLLATLARNLCSPLNVADLARDLDVAQDTAASRLADLADHFLAWPCYRAQGSNARPNAQRKWYFTDPLLARLAALRRTGNEPDLTQLSQQQVAVALLRSLSNGSAVTLADFDAVRYFRASTGAEIDFIGPDLGRIAVESKYTDDRWGREMQTIRASQLFGIIASRSGVEWREDGWVIPAALVALLLGS
jgi:predicted AAA+ superfamily ATPase